MEDMELERLKEKKLRELMASGQKSQDVGVIELDDSNFEQTVSADGLTLVDFWAEWCGPCKLMHPVFERMAKKYRRVRFGRVNVDRNQLIAVRFGVQAIPTFIMFKNGQRVDKMTGAVGEHGISTMVGRHSAD